LTTSATWPESANRMSKLRRVKGIDDVHTRQYEVPPDFRSFRKVIWDGEASVKV
jgi:hypothetical protein